MNSENPRIVIAGVGQIPVGEHWECSLRTLASKAIRAALADSGSLQPQALFVGNAFSPILSHQANLGALLAEAAGISGVESASFEAGGASGAAAVRQAYLAVKSGMADCAIALGVEKITENTGSRAAEAQDLLLNYEYEGMAGMTIPSGAGLLARRYLVEYGLERKVLDCLSLTAYGQACANPNALYHIKLNESSLEKQGMSNAPLGMYNCSALADGAAAVVITREDLLTEAQRRRSVEILGSANATDTLSLHDRHDLLYFGACAASAKRAFAEAGLAYRDIDIWELWDGFSIDTILAREAIGLAQPGEGWRSGGRYYCTMGGCLGRGNPLGASGAYQVVEAVLQLRGEAGACQIRSAESAFVQALGGLGGTAVSHILRSMA